ncbi:MAG: M1 family aminopeptidase [Bacteroidota bacterium]
MKLYSTLISLFLLVGSTSTPLLAQPTHEHHHGCRYTKSQINMRAPTPAERIQFTNSVQRSDTIDILNYDITLEITDFTAKRIDGSCSVRFEPLLEDVTSITLDLLNLPVDSVTYQGSLIDYLSDSTKVQVLFSQELATENSYEVTIYYGGVTTVAASNFGGMAFENGIAYNLGIGLGDNPYNFGRGWFPCFDNFVERATYDLNIISSGDRKAYCTGTFLSEEPYEENKIIRRFSMSQPIPTYLVGVAVSDYETIDYIHEGQYGPHPVQLVARPGILAQTEAAFEFLPESIDLLESWYGPYIWERVGFVMTPRGAMEHATNIAYPTTSLNDGPSFGMNRLMAHELAHHWWGNILTLSGPENMWIKEGNAEYGAHLFTEFLEGKEAFVNQVKSNNLRVLRTAHIQDEAYHPLSGIPFEHTYGVHTYEKGAAMLHNMRAYLGDSLFQLGQKAVLDHYAYQSINAEQYRDHLTLATGVDMTDYFDAWIFGIGYANYELETMQVTPNGDAFEVQLGIQQKLLAATDYHRNAPVFVTFYDDDWNSETIKFMTSGEFSSHTTSLPFNPAFAVINDQQELNLGRVNRSFQIYEPGQLSTSSVDVLVISATAVPDSAYLNVVHHWTAPDEALDEPNIQVSSTHYWSIRGIFPEGFDLLMNLQYKGGEGQFDNDLAGETDEDLILIWRPTVDSDWEEYPFYNKISTGSSGFIQVLSVLQGDYAFANGAFDPVNTQEVEAIAPQVLISPNPTSSQAQVEVQLAQGAAPIRLNVYNMLGQLLQTFEYPEVSQLQVELDASQWDNGLYILEVQAGEARKAVEWLIQR